MGRVLRWTTAGESHGRALVAVAEGVPAGVRLTTEDLSHRRVTAVLTFLRDAGLRG